MKNNISTGYMPKTLVRNFRNSDLDDVARMAQLSFSDPSLQESGTPEAVVSRLKSLRRSHIRLLTRLLGYRLEMIVAEVDGNVAGFMMMTGRDQLNLNTLMVGPQYRRRGIGVTLMEESFRRVSSWGYQYATAEVLASNLPSANLCEKLGFEAIDTFTTYETTLPLTQPAEHSPDNWVTLRPVQEGEQAAFVEIEQKLVSPAVLKVRGSATRFFFPSAYRRLVDYREHKQHQAWAVEKDGHRIGFQFIHSSLGNSKGTLARPLLPDARLNFMPSIVEMAGDWFTELGKDTLRLEIPADRLHLLDNLSAWSWQPSYGCLRLVKWLDKI